MRRGVILSLLRVAGRVIPSVFSAHMLRLRLVRRLLLTSFVSNDTLLSRTAILGLWHTRLTAVFPTHVLFAFEVVFLWHDHPAL
jgi:hypothetical protein